MSPAARSILVYSIYLFGLGAALLLAPNIPLPIFGLPEAHEVWIRVLGMTVIFFASFYFVAARNEYRELVRASIVTRVAVPFVFASFIAAGFAPWNLILFTPPDVLFAAWTFLALRNSGQMALSSAG
jgi:hypothetical protein